MAALAVGMVFLQRQLVNFHLVVSGDPGVVLYAAAFDGFIDEWNLTGRRFEPVISDGMLNFAIDDVDKLIYAVAKPHFTDFDARITTRPTAGPENNGYGLIFRLKDAENHYLFLISSDGYYKVSRRVNGVEKDLSTWVDSALINYGIGVTNTLRVVASAGVFQFYINDQLTPLCIPDNPEAESTYYGGECRGGAMRDFLVDNTFTSGQIGPAVLTLEEPGVEVSFDNLVLFGTRPIKVDRE